MTSESLFDVGITPSPQNPRRLFDNVTKLRCSRECNSKYFWQFYMRMLRSPVTNVTISIELFRKQFFQPLIFTKSEIGNFIFSLCNFGYKI